MKKILVVLLTLVLTLGMLVGCSNEPEGQDSGDGDAAAFLTITTADDSIEISKEDFEGLKMTEQEISRTNSAGETSTGTYKGVAWSELANFAGVDVNSTIGAVASDGYEIELTSDMLNDPQSMFALYENGEPIESQDGGEVWFCAGEAFSANNWAKYLVELKVL